MSKTVAICTSGSRGDTQPYIALALELQKRGHTIRFGVEERMKPLVESFGLDYHKIAGDPTGLLWEKDAQIMLRDGKIMQLLQKVEEFNAKSYDQALLDYEAAYEGADIIVSGPLCMNQLASIAEKNKVPFTALILGPTKSEAYPLTFLSSQTLGIRFLNKLSWSFVFMMMWRKEKQKINPWRVNHLKIPPLTTWSGLVTKFEEGFFPLILGINRNIIPNSTVPKDYPPSYHITGFLFVPSADENEIDNRIVEFIKDSKLPIIYLGFGSMPAPDPSVLVKRAVLVSEKINAKVILCAGWSAINSIVNPGPNNLVVSDDNEVTDDKITLPENLLLISSVPHDYLFPKCSAVVHHCGVGTSAATLRAGTPSVACPVMLDQPFNASRLHQLGVAPPPIPFHELKSGNLIQALKMILDTPKMKERATAIAEEIAGQNGSESAADIIENIKNPWK